MWPEYTVVTSYSDNATCRRELQILLNVACNTLKLPLFLVLEEKVGNVAVCFLHSDPTSVLALSGLKID